MLAWRSGLLAVGEQKSEDRGRRSAEEVKREAWAKRRDWGPHTIIFCGYFRFIS